MERKIKLTMLNPNHYWLKGIYLIRIGRMKYVGKSNCIGERAKAHQTAINKTIKNFAAMVNSMSGEKMSYGYRKVARYLLENPQITEGTVEVLERQICSNILCYSENFYLKEIAKDPDSFNIFHYGNKGNEKDNLWDAKVVDDEVVCFDPRFPSLLVKTNSVSGNQNKATIKKINDLKDSKEFKRKKIYQEKDRLLAEYPHLKHLIIKETINRLVELK